MTTPNNAASEKMTLEEQAIWIISFVRTQNACLVPIEETKREIVKKLTASLANDSTRKALEDANKQNLEALRGVWRLLCLVSEGDMHPDQIKHQGEMDDARAALAASTGGNEK